MGKGSLEYWAVAKEKRNFIKVRQTCDWSGPRGKAVMSTKGYRIPDRGPFVFLPIAEPR